MKSAALLAYAAAVAAASDPAAVLNATHLEKDFACCAFWQQHGHFFSGIRLLGAPASSSGPDGEGWVGTAPGMFSTVIGRCPVALDKSYSGMHIFGCSSSGKAKVVAWQRGGKSGGKCKLFTKDRVPELCFGGDSYYPNYRDKYRMGAFTHLARFDDLEGVGTISINPISCAPYLLEMKAHKHVSDDDHHQQHSEGDGGVKPLCGPTFGVIFLNATGTAAPAGMFGYPSWCIKQLAEEHGEDWRTC